MNEPSPTELVVRVNLSSAMLTKTFEYITDAKDNMSDSQRLRLTAEFIALRQLESFLPPFLLVFGTIGNMTVLAVIAQRHLHQKSSIFLLMLFILIAHTIELHMGCGLPWITKISGITFIANHADWVCKVWMFVHDTIKYSANWLVVLLSTDRAIFMWSPLKSTTFCTPFSAKMLSIGVVICNGVTCVHDMWTYELVPMYGCSFDPKRRDFETVAWPWVIASLCLYVPLVASSVLFCLTSAGIACAKYKQTAGGTAANQCCLLSLAMCLSHIVFSCPLITVNFWEYFGDHSDHSMTAIARRYLAREASMEMHSLFMALTFSIYLLTVPQLRQAKMCSSHGQNTLDIEAANIEATEDAEPLAESDEPAPSTDRLLSQSRHTHRKKESTFL